MTEVRFKEADVEVHWVIEAKSAEQIMEMRASLEKTMTLFWADGIVFDFAADSSEVGMKRYLENGVYDLAVYYAHMPTYKDSIEINGDGPFKGLKAVVVDVANLEQYSKIVAGLKEREKLKGAARFKEI